MPTPWKLLSLYLKAGKAVELLDEGKQDWERRTPADRPNAKYASRQYWERTLTAIRDLALALPIPASWRTRLMLKSWKTTLAAVSGLLALAVKVVSGGELTAADIAMVSGLIGLLFAKDSNVTGGTTPQ